MLPLISVIVPVYQTEKYLWKCVDSLIGQTYKNLEIILVDDGSKDRCPDLCDQYAKMDKRIKAVHKQNGGVSAARNAGIEISTGKYIAFVDSDDWIAPDMFEEMLSLALKNSAEIVMCGFFLEYDAEFSSQSRNAVKTGTLGCDGALEAVLYPNRFEGFLWNKIFSRSLFGEDRLLKLDENISICEDLLMVCQAILKSSRTAFSTKQYYHYLIRPDSATNRFNENSLDELIVKTKIIRLLRNENQVLAKASYSNSACFLLCKLYQKNIKNDEIAAMLYKESKRYVKEFRLSKFPLKERIRMIGVHIYAPLFCRIWNLLKGIL